MSATVRKTSLIGSSLLVLTVLCSCAETVSENRTDYMYSQPYGQSYAYESAQTVPYPAGGYYGQGAVAEGDRWGPICPMDGSDLSYLSNGRAVGITTPVPGGRQIAAASANAAGSAAYDPCASGYQHQGMMVPVPQPQMMAPMPAYQMPQQPQMMVPMPQPQMRAPVPAVPQGQPMAPRGMASSQPAGSMEMPLQGRITGSNGDGFIQMDCRGKFVGNLCGAAGGTMKDGGQMAPQYGDPSQGLSAGQGNTMQHDGKYASLNGDANKSGNDVSGDWVATEGTSLRSLLQDWGDRAGWRVVWNSDREYIVEAGAVFRGKFMDVSSALIRAFARANPAPQGTFFKGNKVLVINTQEAENAE